MTDEPTSSLVRQLKERITDLDRATENADVIRPSIYPPASNIDLAAAEHGLGFSLPPILRQIYTEVGNGGFGPGYGLIGIAGGATDAGHTIIDLYHGFHAPQTSDPAWQWPTKLVPLCPLGCAMYACIDCTTAHGAIVWYEPNPRESGEPLDRFLIPIAVSLADWLGSWLRDEDWMTQGYEQSELK
jgi:hypothetical protein